MSVASSVKTWLPKHGYVDIQVGMHVRYAIEFCHPKTTPNCRGTIIRIVPATRTLYLRATHGTFKGREGGFIGVSEVTEICQETDP